MSNRYIETWLVQLETDATQPYERTVSFMVKYPFSVSLLAEEVANHFNVAVSQVKRLTCYDRIFREFNKGQRFRAAFRANQ